MSITKDIIEMEARELAEGQRNILHLHQEGTFLRAYEWSAFLACRYLHEFKATKRVYNGIDQPVAGRTAVAINTLGATTSVLWLGIQ